MTPRQQLTALLGVLKTRTRIASRLHEPLYNVSRWGNGVCKPHPRAAKKIAALHARTFPVAVEQQSNG